MRLVLTFTVILAVGFAHAYVINIHTADDVQNERERRSPQNDWKVSYNRDAGGGVLTRGQASRRFGTPDGSVAGRVSGYVDRVDGGYNDGYRAAGGSAFVSSSF